MNKFIFSLRKRRRTIMPFLLGCAGFIVCIIIIGFIPFSSVTVKKKVEQLLKESVNGQCTIDKVTITLWKGVSILGVHYRSFDRQKNGVRISCAVPRVTASFYLIPIIFKHLIINKISLENPALSIECPDLPLLREAPSDALSIAAINRVMATLPYTIIVRSFSIQNAQTTFIRNSEVLASGKGIDCSLAIGLDHGLVLNGKFTAADMIFFNDYRVTGCKASLRIKGTSISLPDCRASLYGGALSMEGGADLAASTVNSLRVSLTGLRLDEWFRAQGQAKGELTGTMNACVNLDKSKFSLDSLKGKGWVKANGVSTRGTSLQKSFVLRMFVPKLETLTFNKIYSDMFIDKGVISTKNFYGKGDPVDFTADGWIKMNGRLHERVEGVFSTDFSKSLPDIVRNSLLPVEEDKEKRAFKCNIEGTCDDPCLEIDQRIVNRAVNNVFDAIGKSIGSLFKK